MYTLTIVLLASKISLVSMHASQDVCERLAQQARAMVEGTQAVESATCTPVPAGEKAPR